MPGKNKLQIIPAILSSSFLDFSIQAKRLSKIAKLIQIDVMDGKFVPEESFFDLKKIDELELKNEWELHLMVEFPTKVIQKWGAMKNLNRVIFHIESKDDPQKVITLARAYDLSVGIAVNPETPIEKILLYLNQVDLVLLMTVTPGKQGQKFLGKIGTKARKLKKMAPLKTLIAVDGGLNEKTIPKAKSWGVQVFDVGSYLAKSPNPKETYKKLQTIIKTSRQ